MFYINTSRPTTVGQGMMMIMCTINHCEAKIGEMIRPLIFLLVLIRLGSQTFSMWHTNKC